MMAPDQILLVSPLGWFRLADGQVESSTPWPTVKGSCLVVIDFEDAQVGVQSTKGKLEYAAALIEKSVRSDGMVNGPLHVFIHRQARHGDGCQSFYTAVPLEAWQQFQTWSAKQRDHCLLVPLAGLMCEAAPAGEPVVLQSGTQLQAFAEAERRMYFASTSAIGNDVSDLLAPTRTLMTQLRTGGWRGASDKCAWGVVLPESAADVQELIELLASSNGLQAKPLTQSTFKNTNGTDVVSSIPPLLSKAGIRHVFAPPLNRAAWLSEQFVMPLAAMVAVVAVGLGAFSVYAQRASMEERATMQRIQGELAGLRERATQVQTQMPQASETGFARQMAYSASHDPLQMLKTLRSAAGTDVRIQRVQLAKPDAQSQPRFRVDGVVANGSAATLSAFLTALREQGWQAESTRPTDGTLGAFAYFLQPILDKRS